MTRVFFYLEKDSSLTLLEHLGRGLGWIIHLDHAVVITAMGLCPMGGRLMGFEWADLPRADLQGVGHGDE
jgi:hypothetical protein